MRVFEPGDQLRFGLESTNEVGVVGQLRSNHLDRRLTTDSGLIGAVDGSRATFADLAAQLVSTHGEARLGPEVGRRPVAGVSRVTRHP